MAPKINRNVWFYLVEQAGPVDFFEFMLADEAFRLFVQQWLDLLANEDLDPRFDQGQMRLARDLLSLIA